jgi:hypothetical protein
MTYAGASDIIGTVWTVDSKQSAILLAVALPKHVMHVCALENEASKNVFISSAHHCARKANLRGV